MENAESGKFQNGENFFSQKAEQNAKNGIRRVQCSLLIFFNSLFRVKFRRKSDKYFQSDFLMENVEMWKMTDLCQR